MDLFTYLMAKNDHNTSINEDLFAYLLGKAQGGGGEIKTASGVTIYIPDAKKLVSFMMTKESTQEGIPTPDNPVPVNVVEGYRNLFDISTADYTSNCSLNDNIFTTNTLNVGARNAIFGYTSNNQYTINDGEFYYIIADISLKSGTATSNVATLRLDGSFDMEKLVNPNFTNEFQRYVFKCTNNSGSTITKGRIIFQPTNTNLSDAVFEIKNVMISKGDYPYVPYGNNYVAVNVSDGTNTNKYPIPLNNNILAGIGDYKDELIVDKSGNVFINKKTGKIILDGSQGWGNTTASDGKRFTCNAIKGLVKIPASTSTIADIICDRFISETANDTNSSINGIAIAASGNIIVYYDVIKNYGNTQATQWFASNITTLYYALETPGLIDLQTTVDIELFKGVNNISNSEDGYMTIEYQ